MESPYSNPTSVVVICGGPSVESEVSRASAAQVAKALRVRFNDVRLLEFDESLAERLAQNRPDVVFPVMHGPPGEDGTLQGFLEVLGLPYVGSAVAASAFAMNKVVAKQIFRQAGLPVCEDAVVRRGDDVAEVAAMELLNSSSTGVAIKPIDQGSAVGVSFAANSIELARALEVCFNISSIALVERRIIGKEVTVGVLQVDDPHALPPIEVHTPSGWYDFENRYTPGRSEHIIPARVEHSTLLQLKTIAISAHRALGCRDLSRADFLVSDDGCIYLLEVNTLPGMTPTSLFPDAAQAYGIQFDDLVRDLVVRSFRRSQKHL